MIVAVNWGDVLQLFTLNAFSAVYKLVLKCVNIRSGLLPLTTFYTMRDIAPEVVVGTIKKNNKMHLFQVYERTTKLGQFDILGKDVVLQKLHS